MAPALNIEIVPVSQVPFGGTVRLSEREGMVVLVVDDERLIADTLTTILTKNGFRVLTAYDGRSALELTRNVAPDLLLSDVVMEPEMDGTELAIELVRAHPSCKVLLFSGHASTLDLLGKARHAGHNFTLLTKPVHPAELLRQIAEKIAPAAMEQAPV